MPGATGRRNRNVRAAPEDFECCAMLQIASAVISLWFFYGIGRSCGYDRSDTPP